MPDIKFSQELCDIISQTEEEAKNLSMEKAVKQDIAFSQNPAVTKNQQNVPQYLFENIETKEDEPVESAGFIQKSKQQRNDDVHKGRRERVRDSVDKDPEFDSFADHEVLEYLLFDTIPRVDTNTFAHELVDHFGSLWGVLNANFNELTKFSYINKSTARRLRDYIPVARRAELSRLKHNIFLDTTIRAVQYLQSHFSYRNKETIYCACLDVNDRLLSVCKISEGDTSLVQISIKRIAEAAFASGASKIILAHNHPAETLAPSGEDIESTKRICVALLSMNILLVDHIIFTSDNHFSFFQSKLMEDVYTNCDNAIGSDVCRQLRARKIGPPENYVFEKGIVHKNNFVSIAEHDTKYINFNPAELFPKKKK